MGYGKTVRTMIGERLSVLRLERKLTQKQVAEALGVSPTFVNRIEAGVRAVPDDQMDRLMEILGASPDDLLPVAKQDATTGDPALVKEVSDAVFGAHEEEAHLGIAQLHYFLKGTTEEQVAMMKTLDAILWARDTWTMRDAQVLGKLKAYIEKHATDSELEEEEMHG